MNHHFLDEDLCAECGTPLDSDFACPECYPEESDDGDDEGSCSSCGSDDVIEDEEGTWFCRDCGEDQ